MVDFFWHQKGSCGVNRELEIGLIDVGPVLPNIRFTPWGGGFGEIAFFAFCSGSRPKLEKHLNHYFIPIPKIHSNVFVQTILYHFKYNLLFIEHPV